MTGRGNADIPVEGLGPITLRDLSGFLGNDLEDAAAEACPDIPKMRAALQAEGALGAGMTGSGPTVLGLFASPDAAADAYASLEREGRWRTFLTRGE